MKKRKRKRKNKRCTEKVENRKPMKTQTDDNRRYIQRK